jgi:uroporphyrinogen III methyltransferase/synthase
VVEEKITAPAMTIIGKVVSLRQTMNWFENRPLFGQTVMVTRTRQQASDLTGLLQNLGANVIEAPTIEIGPPDDWSAVDAALKKIADYDWVVFTSANGVLHTRDRLRELGLDARVFGRSKIAAIGEVSDDAVKDLLCLKVDLCPEQFVAEALADALVARGEVNGKRYLLLRADIARPILREKLNEFGAAEVNDVPVYETRPVHSLPDGLVESLEKKQVQWITFTSSSTAKNLMTLLGPDYRAKLDGVKLASIGPITTQALKELGLPLAVEATTFNIPGLVDAIARNAR